MLKKSVPYIGVFKLTSGEEIISKVIEETISSVIVSHPLQMVPGQQGFRFAPFMLMTNADKNIEIYKSSIMSNGTPASELEGQYESITSGIALPQKNSIITG